MMELGATVCLPKNPLCTKCPVKHYCAAYKQVIEFDNKNKAHLLKGNEIEPKNIKSICDIENCHDILCFSKNDEWDSSLGVCNYPRKPKKKASKVQYCAVAFIQTDKSHDAYILLKKRPENGLLAGLWEFPTKELTGLSKDKLQIIGDLNGVQLPESIKESVSLTNDSLLSSLPKVGNVSKRSFVGCVPHIFSHINMTYLVEQIFLKGQICEDLDENEFKWIKENDIDSSAISTSVRKILRLIKNQKCVRKRTSSKTKQPAKKLKLNTIDKYIIKKDTV